jgi:hypothetical protein
MFQIVMLPQLPFVFLSKPKRQQSKNSNQASPVRRGPMTLVRRSALIAGIHRSFCALGTESPLAGLSLFQQQKKLDSAPKLMEDLDQLSLPPPLPKPVRKKKQPFSRDDDTKLREVVAVFGEANWNTIAAQLPGRSPRQCRERWKLYLEPEAKNGPWSLEDEQRLVKMYFTVGPKWTLIAKAFPDRTVNHIKNTANQVLRPLHRLYRPHDQRPILAPPAGEQTDAAPDRATSIPISNEPQPLV